MSWVQKENWADAFYAVAPEKKRSSLSSAHRRMSPTVARSQIVMHPSELQKRTFPERGQACIDSGANPFTHRLLELGGPTSLPLEPEGPSSYIPAHTQSVHANDTRPVPSLLRPPCPARTSDTTYDGRISADARDA